MKTPMQIINATKVLMYNGHKFKPNEIRKYENAIWQQNTDDRIEVMMLFFAEALHDISGYGQKRTQMILKSIDERMLEFIDGVNAGTFDLDLLRMRVFKKTNYIFALNEEDQNRIIEMLEASGDYKVKMEE